MLNHVTENFW
jgi:hypothetical protein